MAQISPRTLQTVGGDDREGAFTRVSALGANSSLRPSRRSFVVGGALAAVVATVGEAAARSGGGGGRNRAFKISLAQSSLDGEISAGRLRAVDLSRVASGLGIDAIEYDSRFLQGKPGDRAFLADLRRRAVGEGVWSLLIRVSDPAPLAVADARLRSLAVDSFRPWLATAARLGCHAVGVRVRGRGSEDEQAGWASESLRKLAELGAGEGIDVLVERHVGLAHDSRWLADVVAAVDHSSCGTLPEFSRARPQAQSRKLVAQELRDLMPTARGVSATSYDFDARGNETHLNYPLLCKVIADSGYHGYVGIDYRGSRLSEYAGIERTRKLLERTRSQLASRAASLGR